MPTVDDRLIAATVRLGSFLALGLAIWYATAALLPFWLVVVLWLAFCAALVRGGQVIRWSTTPTTPTTPTATPTTSTTRPPDHLTSGLPSLPLLVVTAILLSPSILLMHAASGATPHWFARADDAYTLLIARSLRSGFPPPDLSWAGATIRYHLGAPLLVDFLSRLTFLPIHAIYYGLLPVLLKIILIAAVLEFARRIAPDLSPNVRVWIPLAVSGLFTIDFYNVAWHGHDFLARGRAAIGAAGMPIFALQEGLFTQPAFDSGWLAVPFIVILLATWKTSTWIEQAALLFAIFLVKPQVFLAAGAGFGITALLELRNRNWRPLAAAALALAAALIALPMESTYGSMTHLTLGCGAECQHLIERHALTAKFSHAVVLPIELVLFVVGFHFFALVLLRARRRMSEEARLALLIAFAGLGVAFALRLVPTPPLRERFLAVYAPIAGHLFMPLAVYLDRIFDVAVDSAYDAFIRLLPLVVIPLLLDVGRASARPDAHASPDVGRASARLHRVRAGLKPGLRLIPLLIVALFNIGPHFDQAKEIAPDAMRVLRAVPGGPHMIITNDLAYDDRVERHLPLLNVWAPTASEQKFWASAFMFNFQYADAADRLRRVDWFFNQASDDDRVRFARAAGIDLILAREHPIAGWRLIARSGRYELYSRPEERR
jgi:hypothetical protein